MKNLITVFSAVWLISATMSVFGGQGHCDNQQ